MRPTGSSIPYAVSKAGINHLTLLLAKVLGPEIRVNAIAPGLINTAMGARTPQVAKERAKGSALGRAGEPEEIASVVAFLAGPGASYIAATTIFADGGIMQSSPGL